jgi:hypothetical protein
MHSEKNVFKNIFNMVMDMKGKTKVNTKVQMNISLFCHCKNIELVHDGSQDRKAQSQLHLIIKECLVTCLSIT